jgi:hypothetical protein
MTFKVAPVKSRRRRRSFPIHAYIGANGGGKSLAAIYDTLPTLAAGRPVVSTVRLLEYPPRPCDGWHGDQECHLCGPSVATSDLGPGHMKAHPLWVPLDDFRTLLEVEFCDVILDEVTGVASSRESAGMPAAVANHLVQLRRRDIALRWTAPSWKRADVIIRECSQGVTLCMGFMPEAIKDADGGDRQWSSRRLFYWRTYDAATFDEWTTYRKEKIKPAARQLMWRPGSIAQGAYDTFDAVLTLGAVTDAGLCMDCGGNRRRTPCACVRPPKPPRGKRIAVVPETDETPAVAVEMPDTPDDFPDATGVAV